ncbi:hypothetical protein M0802_001214 [Mischocyttarus mexicanus]|nr:hypothetical protein M0802_001214 [Mischocyttarus mexicanus]
MIILLMVDGVGSLKVCECCTWGSSVTSDDDDNDDDDDDDDDDVDDDDEEEEEEEEENDGGKNLVFPPFVHLSTAPFSSFSSSLYFVMRLIYL